MVRNCFETGNIVHNFEEYSRERVASMLKSLAVFEDKKSELARQEQYLRDYGDEFCALYQVMMLANGDYEEGRTVSFDFKAVDYRRPKVELEEYDVRDKKEQLELECAFEDGTKFSLSALKAAPQTAEKDEPEQMIGQIYIPDETIARLNEEKLNRIFEFCHRYGFSTFGLDIPMKDGVVDLDAKLADLFEKYQELQAKNMAENPGPAKPSEDEEEIKSDDYYSLVDEVNVKTDTSDLSGAAEEAAQKLKDSKKEDVSLNDVVKNINKFLTGDLHKRKGLSYWEHTKRIDGRLTHVFSIYPTEDPDNYKNDGKYDEKNKNVHKQTFLCRLYVSQDNNGKFYFGYGTPGGKPMDAGLAGDFMGEIKKTGITHLNLKNLPNCDKNTWMIACAQKGIVPTGCSINTQKAETMLKEARAKLTTQEYAEFEQRLMEQWEENARNSGKALATSDQTFIQDHKNEAKKLLMKQYDDLTKAKLDRDFDNFRKAYNATGGLHEIVVAKIEEGSRNEKTGAATTLGAMQTLRETFDIYFADPKQHIGARLDACLRDGKIMPEERRKLSIINPAKSLKDLTTYDITLIYNTLLDRQIHRMEDKIIRAFKTDDESRAHRPDDVLLGGFIFPQVKGSVSRINTVLAHNEIEKLDLPLEHAGLFYERPEELKWKNVQKREEAAKAKLKAKEEEKEKAKNNLAPKVSSERDR